MLHYRIRINNRYVMACNLLFMFVECFSTGIFIGSRIEGVLKLKFDDYLIFFALILKMESVLITILISPTISN